MAEVPDLTSADSLADMPSADEVVPPSLVYRMIRMAAERSTGKIEINFCRGEIKGHRAILTEDYEQL